MEDPDTTPVSVWLPTKEEKTHPKGELEEKNHLQEREGVEMIIMNEEFLGEARIRKGRTSHQRATQDEDIMLTPTPTILKMKVLPVLH